MTHIDPRSRSKGVWPKKVVSMELFHSEDRTGLLRDADLHHLYLNDRSHCFSHSCKLYLSFTKRCKFVGTCI